MLLFISSAIFFLAEVLMFCKLFSGGSTQMCRLVGGWVCMCACAVLVSLPLLSFSFLLLLFLPFFCSDRVEVLAYVCIFLCFCCSSHFAWPLVVWASPFVCCVSAK